TIWSINFEGHASSGNAAPAHSRVNCYCIGRFSSESGRFERPEWTVVTSFCNTIQRENVFALKIPHPKTAVRASVGKKDELRKELRGKDAAIAPSNVGSLIS